MPPLQKWHCKKALLYASFDGLPEDDSFKIETCSKNTEIGRCVLVPTDCIFMYIQAIT
jgi:hypothetical protein